MTCSVDGCALKTRAKGLCTKHYYRMKRHGTTDGSALAHQRRDPVCSVDGCTRAHEAKGLCSMHWQRWKRHGSPTAGRFHHGAVIGYQRVHQLVAEAYGKAADHRCAHCTSPAREWSYDHQDPAELVGQDHGRPVPYSLDISHYKPLCIPCHRQLDANHHTDWSAA